MTPTVPHSSLVVREKCLHPIARFICPKNITAAVTSLENALSIQKDAGTSLTSTSRIVHLLSMAAFAKINGGFPQYYQILGVPPEATRRDISVAYRALALSEHPDKNGGTPDANARFAHINQARDVLSDAKLRTDYDKLLYQQQQDARSAQRRAGEAVQRTAAGEERRRAAEEQGRAQAFAKAPSVSQSAFDHAFRRDRAGHGPPTTS